MLARGIASGQRMTLHCEEVCETFREREWPCEIHIHMVKSEYWFIVLRYWGTMMEIDFGSLASNICLGPFSDLVTEAMLDILADHSLRVSLMPG